jgi:hypothetical protein
MNSLDIFPAETTTSAASWASGSRRRPSNDLAAPFSAAFSNLQVRERLEIKEFKSDPPKIVAERRVKPWAGTTPVLGGPRRPKPARSLSLVSGVVPAHGLKITR